MREKLLKNLAEWHSNYPGRMLLLVLLLTTIFYGLAMQLTQTMRWSDLLPSHDKRTIEYNRILEEFVSASSIIVVVQGEEQRIKEFANVAAQRIISAIDTSRNEEIYRKTTKLQKQIDKLLGKGGNSPKIKELEDQIDELLSKKNFKLVQRIDYKTEIDFLKTHGFMLIKAEDLKNIKQMFTDPNLVGLLTNINNSLEMEYVGDTESISTREKEDQAVYFLDSIQQLVMVLQKYARGENVPQEVVFKTVDNLLIGEPYFLSYDKTVLILNVIPNFTMMDTDLMVSGTEAVQAILNELLIEFPDVNAGLTGMIPLGHDEMVYAEQSIGYTSAIAFIAILVMLMLAFRMWVAPIFAIINLLVGSLWAIGTAAAVVGQLNIMTAMFTVILLGLGIDFSIHIISGFTERRAAGDSIKLAMQETFLKSGKGILMGGITTAFAFLTMIISSSRGMKEMGIVSGTGLLAILLATFLFLPAMLVLRERRLEKRMKQKSKEIQRVQRDITFRFLGNVAHMLGKKYIFTMLAAVVITIILVWSALNITFDQNYMNIEAKGLTSIALQDTVLEKFDLSMDYALILAESIDESRDIAKRYREMSSVAMTEDISLYLPSEEQQKERRPYIEEIHRIMNDTPISRNVSYQKMPVLVKEIERLEMNVIELQDMAFTSGQDKVDDKCKEMVGDPDKPQTINIFQDLLEILISDLPKEQSVLTKFQQIAAPYYKESVLKMSSNKSIELENLPEQVLDRYCNRDRSKFLITVLPAGNIWQDAEFLKRFAVDLERVSDKATGMPPVFRALIEIIGRDGRNAAILTIIIVFVLLWLDYRKLRHALIAIIPLTIGVFWMVGLMQIFGLQLTVMNVMGIPMIIGIGIDDGVHIVHRWQSEGKAEIRRIFSSTGKAILLTSLTTMLAFGSLIFSVWRGFAQLGSALFIGVATCFLATVIIIASIFGYLGRTSN